MGLSLIPFAEFEAVILEVSGQLPQAHAQHGPYILAASGHGCQVVHPIFASWTWSRVHSTEASRLSGRLVMNQVFVCFCMFLIVFVRSAWMLGPVDGAGCRRIKS